MNNTSTVGRRVIGSLVGLLAGSLALGALAGFLALRYGDSDDPCYVLARLILFAGPSLLIGAVLGAAGGATITQKLLKQSSSFWIALLGAMVGALAGAPTVILAGAVLGSGCKAKPAKATGPSS